jgi:hypothetical protein
VVTDDTDDVIDMECERRRRFIAGLREANSASRAELARDIEARSMRAEHPLDRDRREIAELHEQHEAARQRQAEAASPPAFDWNEVDRRINSATGEAALLVARETANALKHVRASSKAELSDEVRSLRLELTALNETVVELRKTLAAERGIGSAVIDLPMARRSN